jgi:23S rRNA (adenine2503-C2)-methyltransferase
MGMGEPLDNVDAVVASARILMDPAGAALGGRRITVSTSGLYPRIQAMLDELPVELAISLNASDDPTRNRLIPHNRKYPIDSLFGLVRALPARDHARITFEYVLLADVNDSEEDAARLIDLLTGIEVTLNLIPFNPYPGAEFRRPDDLRVAAFSEILRRAGVNATLRATRGDDIGAACGTLDGL